MCLLRAQGRLSRLPRIRSPHPVQEHRRPQALMTTSGLLLQTTYRPTSPSFPLLPPQPRPPFFILPLTHPSCDPSLRLLEMKPANFIQNFQNGPLQIHTRCTPSGFQCSPCLLPLSPPLLLP